MKVEMMNFQKSATMVRQMLKQPCFCVTRSISLLSGTQRFTPRRALLYVPGDDEKKIEKAAKLDIDAVILDCEDGVAINKKEVARDTISKAMDSITFGSTELCVRFNPITDSLCNDDMKVIFQAKTLPATLLFPKVEDSSQIDLISESMHSQLSSRLSECSKISIIIYIESALGLINLHDICKKAARLSETHPVHQFDGIVFGSDDFCASIGATRTEDASELMYARQKTVVNCKAFGMQAIDLVHINFKDLDGLRKQSIEGARMGFTGKQVIHPVQVPVVQEAFSPSKEKVEWATKLVVAFEEHQKSGKGAFTFQGCMIDMPSLRQALNILKLAELSPS